MARTFLSRLSWRFAVKKFDPKKSVRQAELHAILRAVRFAPSSFGLQPYHVVVVGDRKLRRRMRLHSYLQPQVTDCRYLLVFCARTDIDARADGYADIAVSNDPKSRTVMKGFRLLVKNSWGRKKASERLRWATHQVYIALGFALAACAELGVDSCPMEGFNTREVDRILGLPRHMRSVVYLAVGRRKKGPAWKKVRFPDDDLFTVIS
ncbi:hypothetical protein AMJ57_01905 [Parcubacteria bacterium SG8_24]|nr:MAG: hypothetical protein AMJ57_01905 [Parcubacteria bacterium SG8_24]